MSIVFHQLIPFHLLSISLSFHCSSFFILSFSLFVSPSLFFCRFSFVVHLSIFHCLFPFFLLYSSFHLLLFAAQFFSPSPPLLISIPSSLFFLFLYLLRYPITSPSFLRISFPHPLHRSPLTSLLLRCLFLHPIPFIAHLPHSPHRSPLLRGSPPQPPLIAHRPHPSPPALPRLSLRLVSAPPSHSTLLPPL